MSQENADRAAAPRETSWEGRAATVVIALVLLNESLPVVFGTGARATWDWSFTYVTLRMIVIPAAAILVGTSSILRLPFSRGRQAWFRFGAALVSGAAIYASWITQLPLFAR
jgi:hypothetical protein